MSENGSTRRRISAELVVGVSAVVIGVCALGVSLYETSLMREEQRAAVIPLIELSRSYSWSSTGDPSVNARLSLQAENVGIGPARVMDFRVLVDGEPRQTWNEAFQALLDTDEDIRYGQSTINGRTIPPERMVTMFNLADTEYTGDIVQAFDRLEFQACFCSIFDECWQTSYKRFGTAEPVESCQPSEASFRQ